MGWLFSDAVSIDNTIDECGAVGENPSGETQVLAENLHDKSCDQIPDGVMGSLSSG
jgi:hypothetical protein